MNREEAQEYVRGMTTGHHKDATSNHYNDVAKAVDKIYDDFESRICKNCKYHASHAKLWGLCSRNGDSVPTEYTWQCGGFERTTDGCE